MGTRSIRSRRPRPVTQTLRSSSLVTRRVGKGPRSVYAGGAAGLKAAAEEAGIALYVHAPYVLNVATTNNRIRIPSRKFLQQYIYAAAEIGAAGVIVHGGHVLAMTTRPSASTTGVSASTGWRCRPGADREHRRRRQRHGPAAGGGSTDCGMRSGGATRPASASTPATPTPAGRSCRTVVDRVKAITGRIDLVHANDSRDVFDSGADRHANFGEGRLRSTLWPSRPPGRGPGRGRDPWGARARRPTSPG